MNNILKVKNLTKYYGKTLGIQNINFELYEGEVFGFIGPNGAGKSTTIRSILNLINKSSGKVFFNGKKLNKDDLKQKKEIGYLPSEINLYEDYTVKEMLDFHEKFFNKNLKRRRKDLVERLKLDESKKIEELSLGNLKKIGIILAFMHEPKLIILDEPTSGLDPIIQQVFFFFVLEEKNKGTTIFYSTHILNEISKVCDRVGIIKGGQLLKVESINEILDKNLSYVTITSEDCERIVNELKLESFNLENNNLSFKNTFNSNLLIKTLSKFDIEKIYIEQASIEDVFLHYYE